MSLWLLVTALACREPTAVQDTDASVDESGTSSTDVETGDTAAPVDTDAYLADDDSEPPEIDLEALGSELTVLFDGLWGYNPTEIFGIYDELLARHATADCPKLVERTTGTYWNGSCTTPDGATFDGYLSRTDANGGDAIAASGVLINSPSGALSLSGDYFYSRQVSGTSGNWRFRIEGTTTWDGDWPEESWLSQGRDSQLVMEGLKSPSGGVQAMVSGRLLSLDGAIEALVFVSDNVLHEGGGCPQEIGGELTALVDGVWVDLYFDGPQELLDEVDPELCDGCGRAWARGYELGKVCADPTGLLAWAAAEEAPF